MKYIMLFILLIVFFACDENKDNQLIQPESKVMLQITVANNHLFTDNVTSVEGITEDNEESQYYLKEYWNKIKTIGAYPDLFWYEEDLRSFEKESSYYAILIDKDKLKNKELIINMGEKEFKFKLEDNFSICAGENEKKFNDLIDDYFIIRYMFRINEGDIKFVAMSAVTRGLLPPNCSKEEGTSSGIIVDEQKSQSDSNGIVTITKYNGNDIHYEFNGWNYSLIDTINYKSEGSDFNEYKLGWNRWSKTLSNDIIETSTDIDSLIFISAPFHKIKEKELLKFDSSMIEQQPENEKTAWYHYFNCQFANKEFPLPFEYGTVELESEMEFYFNSIPKKYGDMWDYDFKCIRKLKSTGEEILNFEGNAKVRHFRNDIFHCFNENNEWICKE